MGKLVHTRPKWRWPRKPDGIVAFTRWNIQVRVGERTATIGAEMLVGTFWRGAFQVYPDEISWDDGAALEPGDRALIMSVLETSARKQNIDLEIIR
jgi:hypothetical protein